MSGRDWQFGYTECTSPGCCEPLETHGHLWINPENPKLIVWYWDETQDEARARHAAPEMEPPADVSWATFDKGRHRMEGFDGDCDAFWDARKRINKRKDELFNGWDDYQPRHAATDGSE